jgi:hypothetical protein
MQKYMVSNAFQAELAYLPPERRTGRVLDEAESTKLGRPLPEGVATEKDASEYLALVGQCLKGVQ